MFSHRELCELAAKWLKRPLANNAPACNVSFIETQNVINNEVVDSIGFKISGAACGSVLVEVKTSRSDFLADKKKPHRLSPALGVGLYRYYLAPAGIIELEELPEKWGLIEVNDKRRIIVRMGHVLERGNWGRYENLHKWQFEHRNIEAECSLLTMVLNRINNADDLEALLKENNKYKYLNNDLRIENHRLKQKVGLLEYLEERSKQWIE